MEKSVNIGNVAVMLKANAATPYVYREMFGTDLLADLSPFFNGKPLEYRVMSQLTYTMAREANGMIPANIVDWLAQFDSMTDLIEVWPVVMELWAGNNATVVKPKKKSVKQSVE